LLHLGVPLAVGAKIMTLIAVLATQKCIVGKKIFAMIAIADERA
jgi:hypothetical protein